jgi:leucyl-tRNA synthetase
LYDFFSKGPETVKELQRGWIGLSSGHNVVFEVQSPEALKGQKIVCFTTKIETLPGVKFVALSPSHDFVGSVRDHLTKDQILSLNDLIHTISTSKESNLREGRQVGCIKLGTCMNYLTGKEVPIYIADYVLEDYGTGAVMGVPSLDERDQRLANKEEIAWNSSDIQDSSSLYGSNWLKLLQLEGKISNNSNSFSLRDWLVSRQRYWGTPIPIVHCKSCGIVPVPESDLPIVLPEPSTVTSSNGRKGSFKLNKNDLICTCPRCGATDAQREADTLDTFVDSSWYFLRFLDPMNKKVIISKDKASQMPVKAYIGGMEHAIKHLLYARFVNKFLFDLECVPCGEPFENIITQGLVKGESFRLKSTGQYITKEDAQKLNPDELIVDVEKMSKSKLNGISPIEAIHKYGVDCLKLALVFAGPVEKDILLSEGQLNSMVIYSQQGSFLDRVEKLILELGQKKLKLKSSLKLEKISRDYGSGFNNQTPAFHVSVARVIELFNLLKKHSDEVSLSDIQLFLQYLYPFASMFSEDIWAQLSQSQGLIDYKPLSKQVFLEAKDEIGLPISYTLLLNSKKVENFNIFAEEISKINSSILVEDTFKLDPSQHKSEIEQLLAKASQSNQIKPSATVKQVILNNKKRLLNILYSQN